jgi:Terminase large subunit, T4likevirus-type, N-terminal
MKGGIDIACALTDRRLLGAALGDPDTWRTWLAVLKAAFCLPLDEAEREVFAQVAGGRAPPGRRVRELWAVAGRRCGKSRVASALACFLALFVKHKLAHGERGMVLVLAASIEQAKAVFSYALAFLRASPVLEKEVDECTANEIRLKNGVIIAIHSNSFRTIRGRTLLAAIFDEVSFWRDETSSQPDIETYRAALPSLVTTDGMLVGISTPYRKIGLLHQKHRDHFGKDDNGVLVVSGGTKVFNPSISDAVISAQRAADPEAADAEWDAEFRRDISGYLDDATIEAAIDYGRPLELPPRANVVYKAFVDASGGRSDHYTLAVGHKQDGRFVIDCITGRPPPFDPGCTTRELAEVVKRYHCHAVAGDNYSAEWVQRAWQQTNISYTVSELNKSAIYIEVLPLFTQGLVSLPDHPRLLRELRLLERRTHRSGKDSVFHSSRGGTDDYSNAVCGLLYNLSKRGSYRYDSSLNWVS